MKSMDDLPNIDPKERFTFAVELAEILVPCRDAFCAACSHGGSPLPWRIGIRVRAGSCWVGFHWSRANRRLCVNLIPFITIWICPPGGVAP